MQRILQNQAQVILKPKAEFNIKDDNNLDQIDRLSMPNRNSTKNKGINEQKYNVNETLKKMKVVKLIAPIFTKLSAA